jgi:hypothetical protein
MNRKEDDIRKQLDFDEKANREEYEDLFDILSKIEDEPLHDRVYTTVMHRIEQKEKKRKLMIFGSYILGILAIIILSLAALVYFMEAETISTLLDYSAWIVIGAAALFVIQYLDYNLVKKRLDQTFMDLRNDPSSI